MNRRNLAVNSKRNSMNPQLRNRRFLDTAGKQALKMLASGSRLVNGPVDPRPISRDIIVTKTFEYIPVGTGLLSITPAFVAAAFPGGATVFTRFRLVKLSAYGPAVANGQIRVVMTEDEADFVDHGTQGSVRPQLHISPTFNQRNIWLDSSASTVIATGDQNSTGQQGVIYQITVEMRSLPDTVIPE